MGIQAPQRRRRAYAVVVATLLAIGCLTAPSVALSANGSAESHARPRCRTGYVALTFDDGPRPKVTRRLLRVLRRNHAKASFFVQGYRAAAYPATLRRIARDGHVIGNHSWNHPDLTTMHRKRIRKQLAHTNRAIRKATGRRAGLVRPPYGASNRRVDTVIRRLHLTEALWDVDSLDWKGSSRRRIVRRVLSGIDPGSNTVLLHDGVANSRRTVAAVPRIIRRVRRRGYCVVRLGRDGEPRER